MSGERVLTGEDVDVLKIAAQALYEADWCARNNYDPGDYYGKELAALVELVKRIDPEFKIEKNLWGDPE